MAVGELPDQRRRDSVQLAGGLGLLEPDGVLLVPDSQDEEVAGTGREARRRRGSFSDRATLNQARVSSAALSAAQLHDQAAGSA